MTKKFPVYFNLGWENTDYIKDILGNVSDCMKLDLIESHWTELSHVKKESYQRPGN